MSRSPPPGPPGREGGFPMVLDSGEQIPASFAVFTASHYF